MHLATNQILSTETFVCHFASRTSLYFIRQLTTTGLSWSYLLVGLMSRFVSQLVIGKFSSVLPQSDANGMFAIESERKYLNLVQLFKFMVKSYKTFVLLQITIKLLKL